MPQSKRNDAVMPLKCGDCGTEWNEYFSLPMLVDVFVQRKPRCPHCGSKKAMMQPKGDFWIDDDNKKEAMNGST